MTKTEKVPFFRDTLYDTNTSSILFSNTNIAKIQIQILQIYKYKCKYWKFIQIQIVQTGTKRCLRFSSPSSSPTSSSSFLWSSSFTGRFSSRYNDDDDDDNDDDDDGLPNNSHQSYSHQVGIYHNDDGWEWWEYITVTFPSCINPSPLNRWSFLAVHNSSIGLIVPCLLAWSDQTNNQSLHNTTEWS